jgi:two-component system phosphate regulon sensor histidine kinase PhoR
MTTKLSSIHNRQFIDGMTPTEGEAQELADVLQKIVQNTGALLEVSNCSVALLDATGTTLVTLAALHKQGRKPRRSRFRMNEGIAGWVAEHREPLVIHDVSHDLRFKRLGRTPIGSMVCVPLIDSGNFIGTLTVSSQEIHAFSVRRLQMLTILADQAVLAITNARHAELAQRQANQLEMLLNLSRGITTRLEPDALCRTILADARKLVPCDTILMYKYNESGQELYPVAELSGIATTPTCEQDICPAAVITEDVQQEKIDLYSVTSVAAWAASHRHPILRAPAQLSTDEPASGLSAPSTSNTPNMPNIAEMATPLVSKNILYGVLLLQRAEAFTSDELRLIRNLSNMAAAALENVELFHRVRSDQEQLRAILESSSDGIAIIGLNCCFVEANPAFGRIFEIAPEQVVGMECLELLGCEDEHGSDLCTDMCMVHKALQLQEPLPYKEYDLFIKDSSRSIGLSITPVSVTNNPFCLMMARDVTAIRDANRLKANFLSMITHELRSPLNAINGYLDLALTGIAGELNEQQHEFVQRARASSEHLYALVEDLLLVSRADSGQVRLNRDIISLQEIVANAVEELELTAKDNNVAITVEVPFDFQHIYADAVRIQQVLRNLISNALRFTPAGGNVTIATAIVQKEASEEEEKLLELQVRDTGTGIASEHQQRIFDRFYQAPQGYAGRIGGQGLGLAIVKMIVELHGGTVTVESAPGQGSTFTCLIPCLLS